ncbi:MAG: hypothetical protein P4M00_21610 [Azospirillaceae bacterium]|nr:hypothetical protein [Azospirillaceae bacterium]
MTNLERSVWFLYRQRAAFSGKIASRTLGVSPLRSARFDVTKPVARVIEFATVTLRKPGVQDHKLRTIGAAPLDARGRRHDAGERACLSACGLLPGWRRYELLSRLAARKRSFGLTIVSPEAPADPSKIGRHAIDTPNRDFDPGDTPNKKGPGADAT